MNPTNPVQPFRIAALAKATRALCVWLALFLAWSAAAQSPVIDVHTIDGGGGSGADGGGRFTLDYTIGQPDASNAGMDGGGRFTLAGGFWKQATGSLLSIGDASASEGDGGTASLDFTVSLVPVSSQTVTVVYATTDDTAAAEGDYASAAGLLTFLPGEGQKTISIQVKGDFGIEPDERFFLDLSSPVNAQIAIARGAGTILNDDVAPSITLQPQNRTLDPGQIGVFNVVASGSGVLTYQWRKGGVDLSDGGRISGSQTGSLTISNAQQSDEGDYTVVVNNETQTPVTSQTATLTVNDIPMITAQPQPQVKTLGESAVFSVTANGTPPLMYQWRKNGAAIPGATSSMLSLENLQTSDGGGYSVVVVNTAGSATSQVAPLTLLLPDLVVTAIQLDSLDGNNAVRVGDNYRVRATIRNQGTLAAPGGAAVRFQISAGGETYGDLSTQILAASLAPGESTTIDYVSPPFQMPEGRYTYRVSVDVDNDIVESFENNNQLSQFFDIEPEEPPNDLFADRIDLGGASDAAVDGFNINAADGAEFGEPKLGGVISTFNTVWWEWTAPRDGIARMDTVGSDFDTILAVYQGPVGAVTGLGGTEIAFDNNSGGAGTSALEFNAVNGGVYYIKVASLLVNVEGRIKLNLSINTPPTVALTAPADQAVFETVAAAGYRASFTMTASAADSDGTLASVAFLLNGAVVGEDASAPYSLEASDLKPGVYTLQARATDNKGRSLTTPTRTIFVDPGNDEFANAAMLPPPNGEGRILVNASNVRATQDDGEPSHAGNAASSSLWWSYGLADDSRVVVTTAGSGIDTVLAVYRSADFTPAFEELTLVADNDDAAPDGSSALTFNAEGGTLYLIAVDGFGGRQGDLRLELSVTFPPNLAIQTPAEGQMFTGASGVTVPIQILAAPISFGAPKTITSVEIFEGQNLLHIGVPDGANQVDYNWTGVGAGDYQLRAVATDSEGLTKETPLRNISVMAPLTAVTITQHPQPRTAVLGDTVSFSVASSGSPPFSHQWFKNEIVLPGRTDSVLTLAGVQASDAGSYHCRVDNAAMQPRISNAAVLTVIVPPTITQQPAGATVQADGSHAFMVAATGTAPLAYQWQFNGVDIEDATMAQYVVGNAQAADSGNYTVRVSNAAGPTHAAVSSPSLLIVEAPVGLDPPNLARSDFWVADGPVTAVAESGGLLFLGGGFRFIGPNTGSSVLLSPSTGAADANFPKVDGQVSAIAPDGLGGWFIGGAFTAVGGQLKSRLAHILADGSVDAGWTSNPDGSVNALALRDGRLFVGGAFANIGGKPRTNLASVDAGTGLADDWNLSTDGRVLSLAAADGVLYVGGEFLTVTDGVGSIEIPRRNLARFNLETERVDLWRADANKPVFALAVDGPRVFVGGAFTSIKGAPREMVAALDASDATVNANLFAPQTGVVSGADNTVRTLAVAGGLLYLGGDFSILHNHDRHFVGAVDIATGDVVMNWDPNANGRVDAITVAGNSVYLGGEFSQVGSVARNRLVELAPATGNAAAQSRPWNPNASSAVRALAYQDGKLLVGGAFRSVGGVERRFIAAMDKLTGRPTDWAPNLDGDVRSLLAGGRTLYAGGSFGAVGGSTRQHAAAWDIETGQLISWNPDVTDSAPGSSTGVDAMTRVGDQIYLGGKFTHIGGAAHDSLGAVDAFTGMPTAWSAHPDGRVFALTSFGGHLYVGGQFSKISGVTVGSLTRVMLATGRLDPTPWAPMPNDSVLALTSRNGILYAGGLFRDFGGGDARRALAALDVAVAAPTSWNPQIFHPTNPGFAVNALRIIGDTIYVGGDFQEARGQVRENLAAVSLSGDGVPTPWNPNPDAAVYALTGGGNAIYAGGRFTSVAGQVRPNIAAFALPGSPVIVSEPADVFAAVGGEAALAVEAMGEAPLTYQWRKNGVDIADAVSPSLTLSSVTETASAIYSVVVRNDLGFVTSRNVSVAILEAPMITSQPQGSGTVNPDDDFTLTVSASGGQPLTYQWEVNGVNLSGEIGATLSFTDIQPNQSGVYRVVVSNPVGSVLSGPVDILVDVPSDALFQDAFADSAAQPIIGKLAGTARANNASATVERGGGAQEPFHGGKHGDRSLWFTWKAPVGGIVTFDTRGSDIDTVLGVYTGNELNTLRMVRDADDHKDDESDMDASDQEANFFAASVKFEAVANTDYHIAVDGFAGTTGNVAVNWVLDETEDDLPEITEATGRQIVKSEGEPVELRILGFGVALSFKWFHNGVEIPGANSPLYVIESLDDTTVGHYQAEASNQNGMRRIRSKEFVVEIGDSDASTVGKLQDLESPPAQGASSSGFRAPQNLVPVSAGVLGTQVANNARSSTQQGELRIANQLGGSSRWLRLEVSENTRLTVDTEGSEIDTLMAIYTGANLLTATFSDLSFVGSDDNSAPDGLRSRLANIPVSPREYLIVVDGKGGQKGEIKINYRLGDMPTITQQPTSDNGAPVVGQNVALSVGATGSPAPAFQWRFNGEDIPGATQATLMLSDVQLSHSGSYSVVAKNHMGQRSSQFVSLSVAPGAVDVAPIITAHPQSRTGCVGGSVMFSVTAAGTPAPTYVWRKDGTPIPNETGSTLTLNGLQAGNAGSYDVVVMNSVGTVPSQTATLTISQPPVISRHPVSLTVVNTGDAVMLDIVASGAGVSYQWKRNGAPVGGANQANITISPVTAANAGRYTVEVSNSCGTLESADAWILIRQASQEAFVGGKFGFGFVGLANETYVIYTSVTMTSWSELGRVTLDGAGLPTSVTGNLSISGGRLIDESSSPTDSNRAYRINRVEL